MEYTEEEVLDIIHRWDNSGLLYGLPLFEKQELAPLYENITRIILSKDTIPLNVFEKIEDTIFPICRRLYRRVGSDFDLEKMVNTLIKSVEENFDYLNGNVTEDKKNPVVDFCIQFADTYEDQIITKKQFNDKEYEERVDKILKSLRDILLNKDMVSFVDRTTDEWKIMLSDTKKSGKQVRYWNQKISTEVLSSTLHDTNKGI
jgi:hypothetical protein